LNNCRDNVSMDGDNLKQYSVIFTLTCKFSLTAIQIQMFCLKIKKVIQKFIWDKGPWTAYFEKERKRRDSPYPILSHTSL
jgi:hypothetical protein